MTDDDEMIDVFVTFHALTSDGIIKTQARIYPADPDLIEDLTPLWSSYPRCYYGEGIDWHRTWEGALKRAQEMRSRELMRLDKRHARVLNLRFRHPDEREGSHGTAAKAS